VTSLLLEWLCDNWIADERDVQLRNLIEAHRGTPDCQDALARELDDFAALAEPKMVLTEPPREDYGGPLFRSELYSNLSEQGDSGGPRYLGATAMGIHNSDPTRRTMYDYWVRFLLDSCTAMESAGRA